jgi:hypothetical protein
LETYQVIPCATELQSALVQGVAHPSE